MCSYANRFALVSGGRSQSNFSKKVFRLDLASDDWEEMPNLNIVRANHSSCTLDGIMYVYEGYIPSTIERFVIPQNTSLNSMSSWQIIKLP